MGPGAGTAVDAASAPHAPRMYPKIPVFGHGAHLSPQVLLSSLGVGSGSHDLAAPSGEKSSSAQRRQLMLPSAPLSAAGISLLGAPSGIGGSMSAREARHAQGSSGFMLQMLKGDCRSRARDLATDEVSPECAFPGPPSRGGPWASTRPVSKAGGVERWFEEQWRQADTREDVSVSPPQSVKTGDAQSPRQRAIGKRRLGQGSSVRSASIRACFRHEASEIQRALDRLVRWTMGARVQRSDIESHGIARQLAEALEASGIAALQQRPVDFDEAEEEHDVAGAHPPENVELACSIAMLNFLRWLCGLQPVEPSAPRTEVCKVVSQVLLPRIAEGQKLGTAPGELASKLRGLLENAGHISIMHGEVSLVVAIEESFAATHLTSTPARAAMDESCAEDLARRLAAEVEARKAQRPSAEERSRERSVIRSAKEASATLVAAEELPAALRHFSMLWHAQRPASKGEEGPARPLPKAGLGRMASNLASPKAAQVGAAGAGRRGSRAASPSPPSASGSPQPRPGPLRMRKVHVRDAAVSPSRAEAESPKAFGLCSVWGDRRGAVAFRRRLLNPALQRFGASRAQDTCVLWMGAEGDRSMEEGMGARVSSKFSEGLLGDRASPSAATVEAVCFPPTGLVPVYLLQGGRTPWTIMPDPTLYQPTSATKVEAWRVRIDRSLDPEWTAERLAEVRVRGFAIDCSKDGEPFCVIFWPDVFESAAVGDQLEIRLSGLRGPKEELNYFYEFASFLKADLDAGFIMEAARQRALLGDSALWGEPRLASYSAAKHVEPVAPPPVANQRAVVGHRLKNHGRHHAEDVGVAIKPPCPIETLSHHDTTIVTNSVDVQFTLRCEGASALHAELVVIRFGEEEEPVPNGVQVQRLRDQVFVIRAKMPMARCRYQIRFKVSEREAPFELQTHPLKYMVVTGEQCQTLLSSLEDPLRTLFGLARVSPEAQHFGAYVLSPPLRRILVGTVYFLVHIDEAVAQARAEAEASREAQGGDGGSAAGFALRRADPEGRQEALGSGQGLGAASRRRGQETTTTLFSHRLLPREGHGSLRGKAGPPPEVHGLQGMARELLEARTQDGLGEIKLDLVTTGGEHLRRLRPRDDFPGFYEGLVTFSDSEVSKTLRLQLRAPKSQLSEFSQRTLCEWFICRQGHFPIGF